MTRRRRDLLPDEPARDVMVGVAAELFGDKGYHGTSVRDISRQMGIQAGSLYAHIESKHDLLAEVLRRASARAHAVLEPLELANLPVRVKLTAVIETYLEFIRDAPNEARVSVHEFRWLTPEEQHEARVRRRRTQTIVERIIRAGVESGELRPVDEKLVATMIFSITNWGVEWYGPGRHGPARQAREIVDVLIDGLGATQNLVRD